MSASPAPSAVLLDEYVGLPSDHPEAYRSFIRRALTDQVDLPPERLFGPDVWAEDLAAACARYERLLADLGGVDVQLLGIGSDGHIGFNEPSSSLGSRTRIKTLTEATRRDNARFFAALDDVPRHVVTQGLATILDARHLLLVATGPGKAAPIARAVEGPLTSMCPASVLQLHPHATVVVDDAAASGLAARRLLPLGVRRQARLAVAVSLRLESWYVPAADRPGSMRLRLVNAGRDAVEPGFELTFTSVIQHDPIPPARLVRRMSGYQVVAPPDGTGLDPGATWEFTLTCAYPLRHANDGPESAYLTTADGVIAARPHRRHGAGRGRAGGGPDVPPGRGDVEFVACGR